MQINVGTKLRGQEKVVRPIAFDGDNGTITLKDLLERLKQDEREDYIHGSFVYILNNSVARLPDTLADGDNVEIVNLFEGG